MALEPNGYCFEFLNFKMIRFKADQIALICVLKQETLHQNLNSTGGLLGLLHPHHLVVFFLSTLTSTLYHCLQNQWKGLFAGTDSFVFVTGIAIAITQG